MRVALLEKPPFTKKKKKKKKESKNNNDDNNEMNRETTRTTAATTRGKVLTSCEHTRPLGFFRGETRARRERERRRFLFGTNEF